MREVGAYGLRLPDLALAALPDAPDSWPVWRVDVEVDPQVELPDRHARIVGDRAEVRHETIGVALIDRRAARSTLRLREAPGADGLVHPLLGSTAVIANHWLGRTVFHAGAVTVSGAAWAVLADREGGKSSLLCALALGGHPVLTDDILVVDGKAALVGPRCLDLRAPAAEWFAVGAPVTTSERRRRHRVVLGPVAAETPLGGFIRLRWSDRLSTRWLPASERVGALAASLALRAPGVAADRLLDLVDLPCLDVARPPVWSTTTITVEALLERIAEREP